MTQKEVVDLLESNGYTLNKDRYIRDVFGFEVVGKQLWVYIKSKRVLTTNLSYLDRDLLLKLIL